jgi:hypothetical protein
MRFSVEILPRLGALTMQQTADVLGCSLSFVKQMRKGEKQPHPMRFAALEALLDDDNTPASGPGQ